MLTIHAVVCQDGWTVLMFASYYRRSDMVKLLLDYGATKTINAQTMVRSIRNDESMG